RKKDRRDVQEGDHGRPRVLVCSTVVRVRVLRAHQPLQLLQRLCGCVHWRKVRGGQVRCFATPSRLAAGRTHLLLFFGQLTAREAEATNGCVVDAREHRREGGEVVL